MAGAKSYEEEAQALNDVHKCVLGITVMAAVRCAIELGIPEIMENHPGGLTLAELSSELGCPLSLLHRLMRFLTHHRIFKEVKMHGQDSQTVYSQTALSHLYMKNNMAPFFLLMSSPELMTSRLSISKFLMSKTPNGSSFEEVHGMDLYHYAAEKPSFNELFQRAMASRAQYTISKVTENCMAAFEGIGCLVDVGGCDGTALRAIVEACPWIIRAISFDLPHSTSLSNDDDRVEHVAGDMFVTIPSADAVFIMRVLHGCDDEACVKILKNCKEAIPKETGKVILVEIVIDDDDDETGKNMYTDFHLSLDIEVMACTNNGKERTSQEWANLLTSAGFSQHTIKHISALESVIEAYP